MFEHALALIMKWGPHLVGPVFSVLLAAVIGLLLKFRAHQQAQHHLLNRKIDEHTNVLIIGEFDGYLRSECLGSFRTVDFGDHLFRMIVEWNVRPSPHIITPRNPHESAHMREILKCRASEYLQRSRHIDPYLENVEVEGTPSYRHVRFLVCLSRPDAHLLRSQDTPRMLIVEERALSRLMRPETKPEYETDDDRTWLQTLRHLGELYIAEKTDGIAVYDLPVTAALSQPPEKAAAPVLKLLPKA